MLSSFKYVFSKCFWSLRCKKLPY